MIKAVIFDFFGVLANRGDASFRKSYLATDPLKNEQAKKLNDELSQGDLSYDKFIDELAKLGDVSREKVLEYTENYRPNQRLLEYICNRLKPDYKLGIISNAGQNWVMRILGKDNLKLFDDVILSYKVKKIKPEPAIYELSAWNLKVNKEECIFVDDILRYCEGARRAGMQAVFYQDFPQMKKDLETLLAASANN